MHVPVSATCVPLHFKRQSNSPVGTLLKIYVKNILKIDSIHRLTCFNERFDFSSGSSAGLNARTKRRYLDIKDGLY